MVKVSEDRIPLPNTPYKIYSVKVGDRTYPRAPFPRYIPLMLGLNPDLIVDNYNLEIYVNRPKREVQLKIVTKEI